MLVTLLLSFCLMSERECGVGLVNIVVVVCVALSRNRLYRIGHIGIVMQQINLLGFACAKLCVKCFNIAAAYGRLWSSFLGASLNKEDSLNKKYILN